MGKRKRKDERKEQDVNGIFKKLATASTSIKKSSTNTPDAITVQIITGSYERVLHGVTATITSATYEGPGASPDIHFADTFLFNAHSSAIRCLAISPPSTSSDPSQPAKVILASGSTDERINLYHISASPVSVQGNPPLKPTLTATTINENPKNRELGSLLHHSSSISALYFPTRSKLLSAAEDNTIAVVRTRDWTVLSTIKVPIPKALGRPSGDTAPPGGFPAGVNDFAVHPSMKLMVSVGKGEKCMRLWNLVTGKKAGVLSFGREILHGVGEGRWGNGEGRKVEWDSKGEEFAVGFERGVVIFGMDSKPKCRILPSPLTKIHQVRYVTIAPENEGSVDVLALSTEDGRIIFYSTTSGSDSVPDGKGSEVPIPNCRALGQMGGRTAGLPGRVKDFEFLRLPAKEGLPGKFLMVSGSSAGAIRVWTLAKEDFDPRSYSITASTNGNIQNPLKKNDEEAAMVEGTSVAARQTGRLIGTYETGNRITCLKAFVMIGTPGQDNSVSEPKEPNNVKEDVESSDGSGSG